MTLTRREKEAQVEKTKAKLRKEWATVTPEAPSLDDDELRERFESAKNMAQLSQGSEANEAEIKWLKSEMQKSARLRYFWSTYDFPAAIRRLRNGMPNADDSYGFMLGQKFTDEDIYARLQKWGFENSEWDNWLENQAIENRHYQIVEKSKWLNNKKTYIFI